MKHDWPGNIRELENAVARAALSAPGRLVGAADVQFSAVGRLPDASGEPSPMVSLASAEKAHILRVLDATGWNKKAAATVLEIGRATLYRKIAEYGLERGHPERRDG